jgi:C1A family cysteine protease
MSLSICYVSYKALILVILVIHMAETQRREGLGYVPDPHSNRDYNSTHEKVLPMFEEMGIKGSLFTAHSRYIIGAEVDLRDYCSRINQQGDINSCCAHAATGAVEYAEKRAYGHYTKASRLFLYYIARKLEDKLTCGNVGVYPRTTMSALTLFGAPPERFWEYKKENVDLEPPAFCYAFAERFRSIKYVRLDHLKPKVRPSDLLKSIKVCLSIGLPIMFGFELPRALFLQAGNDNERHRGKYAYPCGQENDIIKHSVLAVGYDDNMKIENTKCNKETKGAILIRNSLGVRWGEHGYGWLPYDYVTHGKTKDWWTIIKQDWVNTGKFAINK